MKSKTKRPKISLLHDEIPEHVQEFMQLTRLAEMGRMAASVAHEINNPLMIAQGFAENLEMLISEPGFSRDEMRLQVLEIIKACQRMSRIITKMNRMSRGQKLRLHVVDLAEVALNAVDFLKVQVADLDVRLEFDFSQPMPIKCDVVQVEQIVLNVLSNALYALESVERDRRIRLSFAEVGTEWQQIKIWNNGPPIPAAVAGQIMNPFFTTKPEGQSSGLGLAVSKAIMEVHGGDLNFTSTAGGGTEFVLSFPRPAQNPWQKDSRGEHRSIYIFDRQMNYRRTLQEKFRLLGFDVEAHADFETGFENLCASAAVTGVLIDVVPGNSESLAFVRKVRNRLGPSGLIFTMSHFPSARDLKSEFKAAGASECFEKPIHAENFTFILKQLDLAASAPSAAPVKLAA